MVQNYTAPIIQNFAQGVSLFNDVLLPQYVNWFQGNHSNVSMPSQIQVESESELIPCVQIQTTIYDAHLAFNTILDDAPAYGFTNNSCFNITDCFWQNNYHPEGAVHQRLAKQMVTNLTPLGWQARSVPGRCGMIEKGAGSLSMWRTFLMKSSHASRLDVFVPSPHLDIFPIQESSLLSISISCRRLQASV